MKVEHLNRWLTIAANLGVLAGIALLVFELGQNREKGLHDEAEFSTQQEAWREFLANDRTVAVWCDYRSTVSPEFRVAFDDLLTTHKC